MASKIVDQMKEKMKLAGQTALLAEMIPKREGVVELPSSVPPIQPPSTPPTRVPDDQSEDSQITSNLHLPLALRKQRRPNAGFKPYRGLHSKKLKKANTVKQLKDKLREEEGKMSQTPPPTPPSIKRQLDQKKKMKKKMRKLEETHVDSFKKKKKIRSILRDGKTFNDSYCWICHKECSKLLCQACPRVYHNECIPDYVIDVNAHIWFCPECEKITTAECVDTQAKNLAPLSDSDLTKLFQCAINRMKHTCCGPFLFPVSMSAAPNYLSFIFNPMDLTTLAQNVQERLYGSPEAFLADVKWIVHNCIIYNGSSNKLTKSAQLIVQIAEHEIKEIQLCPDCYMSSCSKRKNCFCEPCRTLHPLVWAKLKGFPFWPAKVLREKDNRLDVRFFGQHDRAWVLVQDCYLISKEMPFPPTNNKTTGLGQAVREVEMHMQKLRYQNRKCDYADFRTPYDATRTYAHRNVLVTKNEPASLKRGKKRKRKGAVKKTYVPILKDLDPPNLDATASVDVEDKNEGAVEENSKLEAENRLESSPDNSSIIDQRSTVGSGGDNKPSTSLVEKDALLSSTENSSKVEMSKGDTPTSQITVSRKIQSKSGKFLALASNITEDARSVVEWGLDDEEKRTPTRTSEARGNEAEITKRCSESGHKDMPNEGSGEQESPPKQDGNISIEQEVESHTESKRDGVEKKIVTEPDKEASEKESMGSGTTSDMAGVPLVLPNILPDPQKLEVETEELSTKVSEGTQMTPQKSDKFNEKLNQTIKSCRKFLGLESESREKAMESDDVSEVKSDLDSEVDSSQDEADDNKMESGDESGVSRQVTPSSLKESESPKSGLSSRKPSGDFDSDSDSNSDQELVIDEDGLKVGEEETGKGCERGVSGDPLASPKLTIKLPFGSKGKLKLADSSMGDDEDDDYDGDKEMEEDKGMVADVSDESNEGNIQGEGGELGAGEQDIAEKGDVESKIKVQIEGEEGKMEEKMEVDEACEKAVVKVATDKEIAQSHRRDTSSHGRDTSSHGRETLFQGNETSLRGNDTSLQEKKTSHQGRDSSFESKETLPPKKETSPENNSVQMKETVPEGKEISPQGKETAPHWKEILPQGKQKSLQGNEISLEGKETSSPEIKMDVDLTIDEMDIKETHEKPDKTFRRDQEVLLSSGSITEFKDQRVVTDNKTEHAKEDEKLVIQHILKMVCIKVEEMEQGFGMQYEGDLTEMATESMQCSFDERRQQGASPLVDGQLDQQRATIQKGASFGEGHLKTERDSSSYGEMFSPQVTSSLRKVPHRSSSESERQSDQQGALPSDRSNLVKQVTSSLDQQGCDRQIEPKGASSASIRESGPEATTLMEVQLVPQGTSPPRQTPPLEVKSDALPEEKPTEMEVIPQEQNFLEKKVHDLEEELKNMKKKFMIEVQEAKERKATHELMVLEIFETYQVMLQDKMEKITTEHQNEMLEVKRKQWCAYCQKEAVFFCCWNTSYCDYPCQQKHWVLHQRVCQQAANSAQQGAGTAVATPTSSTAPHVSIPVNPAPSSGPIPLNQMGTVSQVPPCQVTPGPNNISNLIQYVRFMPMQTNQLLQNVHMRSSQIPPPSMSTSQMPPPIVGAPLQPQTTAGPNQMMTQHQLQQRPPPYQHNTQGTTMANLSSPGNMVRQRMPNGNEVILHIPQNVRLTVPSQ